MARYCFRLPTGEVREVALPMSNRPQTFTFPDGQVGARDYCSEWGGFRHNPGNWPMTSDACAVSPEQIPDAIDFCRRAGVPTDFTTDGRPIFTSAMHRKRHCEARGYYDRNAGYGDPSPRSR